MKKWFVLLLSVLFVFALCACAEAETIYTYEKNGVVLEVNHENGTSSDGIYTYRFEYSGDASAFRVKITYPDGAIFQGSYTDSGGGGGTWNKPFNRWLYVDEDTLCDAIGANTPEPIPVGEIVVAILLVGAGAFYVVSPEKAWHWNVGWRFKDAEPSDASLSFNRIIGIVLIILGVIALFT